MKIQICLKTLLFISLHFFIALPLVHSQCQIGADIDSEFPDDESGRSVSISADGSRVAVGAPFNDGNGFRSGHARVFELIGGIWTQIGADIDGEAVDDFSGWSVSLSSDGNRVAVGAVGNDDSGTNSGHVRVYELMGGNWTQIGADIDGEAAEDESGRSISLSSDGNRIAIGAHLNDSNVEDSGHVRVFEYFNGGWSQIGEDIVGEEPTDLSGWSVSLSSDGSKIAIGAVSNNGNGSSSGHVRIFEFVNNEWVQVGSDIDGEGETDTFGFSVSLSSSGSRVVIGATENDGNGRASGHVQIYELTNGNWVQIGQDIDGESAEDLSGWSVSMSSDGSRVAISAVNNDGNGDSSGHVRIFEFINGNWVQIGVDIDGEAEADASGWSVSLSADGTKIAIGAPRNKGNGSNAGHVRVFELPFLVNFSVKAFLQGPYDKTTANLKDNLRKLSGFPLTEPYSNLGYSITENPGSSIKPTILTDQVNEDEDIVDWIYVALMDINNQLIKSKAALLRKDGFIVDPTGDSLSFNLISGNYRLVVRHRNHLGVMTQEFFSIPFQE